MSEERRHGAGGDEIVVDVRERGLPKEGVPQTMDRRLFMQLLVFDVSEEISVEDAERILHDIIGDRKPRPITSELILESVAEKYGFTVEDLKAKNRHRPLVLARQIGMYLFRELTDLSYPQIAKEFGGRDHTTVIHAFDKISALMKERVAIYDDVQSLIQTIKSA